MLSELEFDKIVNYAKANKLKRDQVFEYMKKHFVSKTSFNADANSRENCVRQIKDSTSEIIGHDLEGNPIVDKNREKEKNLGVKVRTRTESSRSDG